VAAADAGHRRARRGDPEEIGAAAFDYLFYSGYVALAYWWVRAVAAAEASTHPARSKAAKRATARFYFQRILPRAQAHAAAIIRPVARDFNRPPAAGPEAGPAMAHRPATATACPAARQPV
jgi:hypothetical protein